MHGTHEKVSMFVSSGQVFPVFRVFRGLVSLGRKINSEMRRTPEKIDLFTCLVGWSCVFLDIYLLVD